jgi:superfamily II DNA or RNA helicase
VSALERELEGGAPLKLLPHQATFVESVLGAAGKRVTLLRGDVGLGKSTTLVALASRLLREQPTARCLFLVPAALRLQFVDMLRRAGAAALLVDRYQFREMVDSASGGEFWPHGAVAVLSREFARQVDILESVASIQWDLVVADEAHSFRGSRAELLRRIGATAKRLVLASASSISLADGLSIDDAAVVQWRRDQLVDGNGEPLDVVPRPVLNEVGFHLSQAERSLVDAVSEVCGILEAGTPQQAALAKQLLRGLRSSPAPLEAMLQRLAVPSEARDDAGAALDAADEEEEAAGDGPSWSVDHLTAEKAGAAIGRALQEIGAIKVDSKVAAFGGLLAQLIEAKKPTTRICVLNEFLATCYYLVAEIEGRGLACQLVHGGMGADDRLRSLTTFSAAGEILVATRAVMAEGINLSHVTDLVLYDAPESRLALQQVLGRFDRFGRLSQLSVHVLVPRFGADAMGSAPVQLLREILAGRTEP